MAAIERGYPKAPEGVGRPPMDVERILRLHCLQYEGQALYSYMWANRFYRNGLVMWPCGARCSMRPSYRVWPTPNGKANFLLFSGLAVNAPVVEPSMLRLATVRSHDQFNTTIYSYNDRYRGVYNSRTVLFINAEDRAARGLTAGATVDVETISQDGVVRCVKGLTLLDYPMPSGAVAGYYPELNPLLPLEYCDRISGTPAAKSIPVRVVATTATLAQPEASAINILRSHGKR